MYTEQLDNNPLVSICMSSYNNARFVLKTLDSIANQTYKNIHLVIIDDCSTDDSVILIESWLQAYDKPYTFVKNEINKGICTVANLMLSNAQGRYLSMVASDDLLIAEKINDQVAFIAQFNGKAGLVYGDCEMIDEYGNTIQKSMFTHRKGKDFVPPSGNIFQFIVNDFFFYLHTCLIDLDLLKGARFVFDKDIISEDWDIQLALGRKYEIHGQNKVYAKYRVLSTSFTAVNWSAEKMHKIYKSHFLMFNKYVSDCLNSESDKLVVLSKMRYYYWELFKTDKFIYKEKIINFYKILKQTKNQQDLATMFKLIFARL